MPPESVALWENALQEARKASAGKLDPERNSWSDAFATGDALMAALDRERRETKAVMTAIGLVK